MSRGTARSITSSGRPERASMTSPSSSGPMIACGDAVAATTMSAASSSTGRASKPTARPPWRAASASARSCRREATKMVCAPRSASGRAVSSAVSPEPSTSTPRPSRSPSTWRASSTATEDSDDGPLASAVSVRTRLPVASAAPKSRLVSGPVVPASSARS